MRPTSALGALPLLTYATLLFLGLLLNGCDEQVSRTDSGPDAKPVSDGGTGLDEGGVASDAGVLPIECQAGSWCWENPLPHGNRLSAVWAHGDLVLFGGERGVLHDRAGKKVLHLLPGKEYVADIWGTGEKDVVAVGSQGAVWRYDGQAWNSMASGTTASLRGIWGTPGSYYAVGESGTIIHLANGQWSAVKTGFDLAHADLTGVWGSGAAIFIAGATDKNSVGEIQTTSILHYDGAKWTKQPIPKRSKPMAGSADYHIEAVFGTGPSSVYAVAGFGAVLHHDGTSWVVMPLEADPDTFDGLEDVWVAGSEVFAVGGFGTLRRHSNTGWSSGVSPYDSEWFYGVFGTAANAVYAAGSGGRIVRWDGSQWKALSSGTLTQLQGIGGAGSLALAVGNNGTLLRRQPDQTWRKETTNVSSDLLAVWSADGKTAVAVGREVILHLDPASGKWVDGNSGQKEALHGVWGSGANNVIAVGDAGTVLRYNGKTWSVEPNVPGSGSDLEAVWGSGPQDIYVVGSNGVVLHYNGQWAKIDVGAKTSSLSGVWGSGPSNVFVCDDNNSVYHLSNGKWTTQKTPGKSLAGIWGRSAKEVYAAGQSGTLVSYDGQAWTEQAWTTDAWFKDVWVSPDGSVYAVGDTGAILRRAKAP